MKTRALGYVGEEAAAQFLKNKGFEILDNNFTVRGGEIDLIAKKNGLLVFVEVKTRTGNSFGEGNESVGAFKKMRLHRAIKRYLDKKFADDIDYRVDILEVELDQKTNALIHINHFEDIEL